MGQSLPIPQNQTTAILNRHRKDIRDLVDLSDLLLHLSEEIGGTFLTPEENQLLRRDGCTINNEKTDDLIRIIPSKGKNGLPAFMKALKRSEHSGHEELYDTLLKDLRETNPAMYGAVLQFVGDSRENTSANTEEPDDERDYVPLMPSVQPVQNDQGSQWKKIAGYTAIVLLIIFATALGIFLIGLGASGNRAHLCCKKKHYTNIRPFHIVAGITILLGLFSAALYVVWNKTKPPKQRSTDIPCSLQRRCVRVFITVCLFLMLMVTCVAVGAHLTILCLATAELFDDKVDLDGCSFSVYIGLVMIVVTVVVAVGVLFGIMVYCIRYICCRSCNRATGVM